MTEVTELTVLPPRAAVGVRMDVMFRGQPGRHDRQLLRDIERSVQAYVRSAGRAPALVLAVGAVAPPDEVRQAMEAIA